MGPVNSEAQDDLPVALLSLDEHWRIVEVNSPLARMFDVKHGEIIGRQLTGILPANCHGTVMERLACDLKSTGQIHNFELTMELPGRDARRVMLNATARFGENGHFNGAHLAVFDISSFTENEANLRSEIERVTSELAEFRDHQERIENQTRDFVEIAESIEIARDETQQVLNQAEENENRIRTIVTSGILVIDQEGVIQLFNHAAEKIFGVSVMESIGKNINSLIADNDESFTAYMANERPGNKCFARNSVACAGMVSNSRWN